MTLNKFIGSHKKIKPNSLDALLPVLNRIQYIADNTSEFFKDYYDIKFEIDLLSGVTIKIDKKRIFMQTAFGENQIVDAVYEGCVAFVEWFEKEKT